MIIGMFDFLPIDKIVNVLLTAFILTVSPIIIIGYVYLKIKKQGIEQ